MDRSFVRVGRSVRVVDLGGVVCGRFVRVGTEVDTNCRIGAIFVVSNGYDGTARSERNPSKLSSFATKTAGVTAERGRDARVKASTDRDGLRRARVARGRPT